MVLIIGCPSGEYSVGTFKTKFVNKLHFRTSQEELRVLYLNNSNSEMAANLTNSSISEDESQESKASGLLSTETLIYIHGGLMGALFTVALLR